MKVNFKGLYKRKISDYNSYLQEKKIHKIIAGDPKSIPVFWAEQNNFGDRITTDLFDYFGFYALHTSPFTSAAFGAGSIIQILKNYPKWSGCLLGSGLIEDMKLSLPNCKPIAVRGKLTKKILDLYLLFQLVIQVYWLMLYMKTT